MVWSQDGSMLFWRGGNSSFVMVTLTDEMAGNMAGIRGDTMAEDKWHENGGKQNVTPRRKNRWTARQNMDYCFVCPSKKNVQCRREFGGRSR